MPVAMMETGTPSIVPVYVVNPRADACVANLPLSSWCASKVARLRLPTDSTRLATAMRHNAQLGCCLAPCTRRLPAVPSPALTPRCSTVPSACLGMAFVFLYMLVDWIGNSKADW
jgi:hypothetical protein